MDTTKENILMCGKAVKIQELWKPIKSDLFCRLKDKKIDIRFNYVYESKMQRHNNKPPTFLICYDKFSPWISSSTLTWLPHQDQLWNIMPRKVKYIDFERGVKFKEGIGLRLYAKIPIKPGITDHWNVGGFSIEQLLLKLFYKAEFNKVWNGKEWTSQNK